MSVAVKALLLLEIMSGFKFIRYIFKAGEIMQIDLPVIVVQWNHICFVNSDIGWKVSAKANNNFGSSVCPVMYSE